MFKAAKLHDLAVIPKRAKPGDAGMDLSSVEALTIRAGGYALVDTGIVIEIPESCYARVAPRSGLAVKHGITVGAGVVDSNYRGCIKVVLFNHGADDFKVNIGDRVAQIVLEQIYTASFTEVLYNDMYATSRGADGFGSTGV